MQLSKDRYAVASEIRFAAADAYRALTAPPRACVRQSQAAAGFAHTERHLQCIWFDSALRPAALITGDGEPVTVISPGRWNLEAGPDFVDATLRLGGGDRRQLQGDIEIHIHPADWERHGHGGDPRYRRVIAHVTYSAATTLPASLPPGAVGIALGEALAANPAFSMDAVDLTAYPYAAATENCPCAAIFAAWHPDRVAAVLEAAGTFRIEQKAARVATQLRELDAETVLYRETMAALGYKQNAAPFRALAARIPPEVLRPLSALEAYALLLGVSGLLPETPSPRWDPATRALLRRVWDAWWPLQARWSAACLPPSAWTLSSLRPQNHPVRRLAAAATLFAGNRQSLWQRLQAEWRQTGAIGDVGALFDPPPPLDHWLHHLGLGGTARPAPVALVGSARSAAWCANVVLPLFAATGADMATLLPALPPEQTNSVMRQTAHRLFGRDHNPSLYSKSGLRQQGLMQIFHDFCLAERAGCATCTFPAALSGTARDSLMEGEPVVSRRAP